MGTCSMSQIPFSEAIFEYLEEIHQASEVNIYFYFFLNLRAGGIHQILQSDRLRERAYVYDLAC